MRGINLLILVASVLVFCVVNLVLSDGGSFCYDSTKNCGPKDWPDFCNKNNGMQSPIDLKVPENQPEEIKEIKTNDKYGQDLPSIFIQVTGTTVKVQADASGSNSGMELTGDGLDGKYLFAQLHFHWGTNDKQGSEHLINGKAYPMEMHFVHYSSKYKDLGDALGSDDPNAIGVVGLFFEVCKACEFGNRDIEQILMSVKQYQVVGPHGMFESIGFGKLNLKRLMKGKAEGGRFFRYSGSLTTPPCSEKVLFTIIQEPLELSELQLKTFQELVVDSLQVGDNFRPIQDVGNRKVDYQNFSFK